LAAQTLEAPSITVIRNILTCSTLLGGGLTGQTACQRMKPTMGRLPQSK
jgi:hypothetical protein